MAWAALGGPCDHQVPGLHFGRVDRQEWIIEAPERPHSLERRIRGVESYIGRQVGSRAPTVAEQFIYYTTTESNAIGTAPLALGTL